MLTKRKTKSYAKNTQMAYTKWQTYYDNNINGKNPVEMLSQCYENGLSLGTIQMIVSALKARGDDMSEADDFLSDLKRIAPPPRRVKPILAKDLLRMLMHCDYSTRGLRDASILSLGFSAALRREELCGLLVSDIEFFKDHSDRAIVKIRRSKTDQAGHGANIPILDGTQIKPVTRLKRWLLRSQITEGPLLQTLRRGGNLQGKALHHSDIPRLVKFYGAKIGLDPKTISGHSLRSGFITSAAQSGARLDKIMTISRHKTAEMVLLYIRDAQLFEDHAGAAFL